MKSYSPYDSISELMEVRANRTPDRLAVNVCGQARSYEELWTHAARTQRWFQAAGVRPGQHVALMLRNGIEFVEAWLGLARAGAVAVPVNTAMVGEPLYYTLDHSDAVGIVADSDLLAVVRGAGAPSALRWSVAVGAPVDRAIPWDELADASAGERAPLAVDGSSAFAIIYTSGTTGPPKGVILSHTSYLNTGAYFARHLGLSFEDVIHTCLPLFHCNAQQTSLMAGLHVGAPVHVDGKFSLSNFWSCIERSGATITNLLGTMLVLLSKFAPAPEERQETLRYILAAPVPEHLHRPLEERLAVRIIDGYGLTETGTMACINPPDDCRTGTIGLPLEHNELMIADNGDRAVPDGTPGQILTRTRIDGAYMSGYFKEPAKTAEAMEGGWFHTGDLGMRRDDGYFVFLDRMKDTIRRRGENISSYFVERAVNGHPDVLESAAVGVPSDLDEEEVKVIVVRRPGSSLNAEELSAWCDTALSDFMRPRYIEFRADFPRTETGRIHKYLLRSEGVGNSWERSGAPIGKGASHG